MNNKKSNSNQSKNKNKKDGIAKISEKDFKSVLNTLQKDITALKTPKLQLQVFVGSGFYVSIIPIVLYATDNQIFLSYFIFFLIGIVISTGLLAHTYVNVASKTRKALFVKRRDPTVDEDVETSPLIKQIREESASYAVFTVNFTYILLFIFFAFYLLRPYEIPSYIHYLASTSLPALITLGVSRFY